MTVPTISNLPTVPATSDPNFETEAPALFNHIKNTFVSEMNSAISFINSSTFDATVEFKNANFTAARNFLYMIDTSSAAVSVTLPANPSTGDQLLLMDQKRNFGTNNLTIVRNSQNINGAASDVVSKSTGALIRCIFQASYGWTVDLYEGEWESGTSAGDLVYTGGNVGIGTSEPTGKLDVNTGVMSGDIKIGNFDNVNNGTGSNTHLTQGTKLEFIADTNPRYSNHNTNTVAFVKAEYDGSDSTADVRTGNTALTFATHSGFADSGTLSEKMRISSFGNVGIGTSAPYSSLTVRGTGNSINLDLNSTTTGSNSSIVWNGSTSDSNPNYSVAITGYREGSGAAGALGLKTRNGTSGNLEERMLIDSSGNVGIGTSAPGAELDVRGALSDTAGGFQFGMGSSTASYFGVRLDTSGNVCFDTYGAPWTERMKIERTTGNVGIGTSSPSAKLEVESPSGAGNTNLLTLVRGGGYGQTTFNQFYNAGVSPNPTLWGLNFGLSATTDDDGKVGIKFESTTSGQTSSDKIYFKTANTNQMAIDSSGRVGIGTSAPSSPLHVKAANNIIMSLQSSDATVGNLYFNFLNDDGDEKGWIGYGSSTTDDFGIFNNEARDLNLGTSGATRLQIKSAGDVQISTGNLVIGTAGKGIDFGVASGSVTSQLLDDYEEGSWTPVVADASSGGNTATGNFSGTYTKVGRVVTVHGYVINVNTTGLTSTNDLFIRGLPFNNRDTIARYGTVRVQAVNFSGYCVVQLGGNANFFTILENISGSTNDVITVSDLTSGTADILFSLTYEA